MQSRKQVDWLADGAACARRRTPLARRVETAIARPMQNNELRRKTSKHSGTLAYFSSSFGCSFHFILCANWKVRYILFIRVCIDLAPLLSTRAQNIIWRALWRRRVLDQQQCPAIHADTHTSRRAHALQTELRSPSSARSTRRGSPSSLCHHRCHKRRRGSPTWK